MRANAKLILAAVAAIICSVLIVTGATAATAPKPHWVVVKQSLKVAAGANWLCTLSVYVTGKTFNRTDDFCVLVGKASTTAKPKTPTTTSPKPPAVPGA
jgi:hypothetical protein